MNKKIICQIAVIFLLSKNALAQSSNSGTQGNVVALQMSQRMSDSLYLTAAQKDQLYQINMALHQQKMALRQQYKNVDSLTFYTQRVENARDSLYHQVLPNDKYLLYKNNKVKLITYH
jgi:uncharacterized coiled-coil protein SlyX